MNMKQEIENYLHYCRYQKKLSQKSIKAYAIDLKQFISYFGLDEEQSLMKAGLCSYISALHKRYSPKIMNLIYFSLKSVIS